MAGLHFHQEAEKRFSPFLEETLKESREKIHSIHIIGSALTTDYHPQRSDVNSVVVLKKMDLPFLKVLAPLGKKYGKKGVSAPLIMTPEYIENSLDVFPVEFLNIRSIHKTLLGEDIFGGIEISRSDLRQQCERELKVRLIGLRQGYLSSSGDRKILTEKFISAFSGYMALFRGILFLLGKEPPIGMEEILASLEETSGTTTHAFLAVLKTRKEKKKLALDELHLLFEEYYGTIETLGKIVDEIKI
jgi:predicted nucleotidyltransferase